MTERPEAVQVVLRRYAQAVTAGVPALCERFHLFYTGFSTDTWCQAATERSVAMSYPQATVGFAQGPSHAPNGPALELSSPMPSPAPAPSNRLLRAAAAEREDLRRHREKLLAQRETLRSELDRIDASLEAVREREALLQRLTGPAGESRPPASAAVDGAVEAGQQPRPGTLLRGPAIRRAAVEVLLRHPDRPEAMHYRDWFQLLDQAGYTVAGKDPLAVFLTQLGRSPVVRRSSQAGVYELERAAVRRLRQELEALHGELRELAAPTGEATDLTVVRARRAEVHAEIGQVEKALEEAVAVLDGPAGEQLRAAS
jgi:hypothetical protein